MAGVRGSFPPALLATGASLQDGINIACILAHANNLEKQQQLQRDERDFDRRNSKRAISSNAASEFRSSRILGFQYRDDSGWVRPPSPRCAHCGKPHSGQCRLGSGACYACSWVGHMMRDCPLKNGRDKARPIGSAVGSSSSVRPVGKGSQVSAGCGRGRGGASSSSGPQNRIYALVRRQDFKTSPDVVTCKLLAFSHDVYALIDPSSTLLYVIPYIAGWIGPKLELIKPFKVFH
ncbi:uncharacterized protein LOC132619840 [Lycium barbarum]|uniref:uncharacterized protein LOC132619840 n=1 Tax=Lycium barbarum TaxID=112863 RepID=UPI00293E0796|nr:uncharacterized protein LOC132619840 [Lycium barbarum]